MGDKSFREPFVPQGAPWAKRFWSHVDFNGPLPSNCPELGRCWIWTSTTYPNGYGQFKIGSLTDGTRKNVLVHRLSYILRYGEIAEAVCVLHRCDNRPCVNFDHLFPGTKSDNSVDMYKKGRAKSLFKPKLLPTQVLKIRKLIEERELSFGEIAEDFGVTIGAISRIHLRKVWRHL